MKKIVSKKLKVIKNNLKEATNLESIELDFEIDTLKKIHKKAKKHNVSIEVYVNYILREMTLLFINADSNKEVLDNITFAELIKKAIDKDLDNVEIIDYITFNKYSFKQIERV